MTSEVVLLIAGLGFLVVGLLGGGLEIHVVRVPPIKTPLRIVIGSLGGVLFALGLLISLGIIGRPTPGGQAAVPTAPPLPQATVGASTAVPVEPTAPPAQASATPAPAATATAAAVFELPSPTADTSSPPQLGTAIAGSNSAIGVETAQGVAQVGRWGKGQTTSLAWVPNSQILALGTHLGIYLIDAPTGRQLRFRPTDDEVMSIAASPNGVIAVGLENGDVELWALRGGLLPILSGFTRMVNEIAFAPDGQTVAAGGCAQYDAEARVCTEGVVRVWRVETGEELQILSGHSLAVDSIAFAPDGQTLISGSDDKTVRVWDTASGELLRTIETGTSLIRLAYSPTAASPIVALAAYEQVALWRADTGAELPALKLAPKWWTSSVAFAPDGQSLAAAAYDGTIRLFGLDGSSLGELERYRSRRLVYSPDARFLATLGEDASLRLFSLADRSEVWRSDNFLTAIPAIAPLPDNETVVVAQTSYSPPQIRRLRDGALVGTLGDTYDPAIGSTYSLAVSPDGKTVATGGWPKFVQLWDVAERRLLHSLEGHEESVRSIAFAPDGATIASGSEDGTIRLWSVATGELLQTIEEHGSGVYRVAFSPDGSLLASGSADMTIRLWSFDGSQLTAVRTLEGHTGTVRALAFAPDGATLASASPDETLRFWSVATGEELRVVERPGSMVALSYTPDGSALLLGLNSGEQVLILRADDGSLLQSLAVSPRWAFLDNVAITSDGRTAIAGLWNGEIHLWQVR